MLKFVSWLFLGIQPSCCSCPWGRPRAPDRGQATWCLHATTHPPPRQSPSPSVGEFHRLSWVSCPFGQWPFILLSNFSFCAVKSTSHVVSCEWYSLVHVKSQQRHRRPSGDSPVYAPPPPRLHCSAGPLTCHQSRWHLHCPNVLIPSWVYSAVNDGCQSGPRRLMVDRLGPQYCPIDGSGESSSWGFGRFNTFLQPFTWKASLAG